MKIDVVEKYQSNVYYVKRFTTVGFQWKYFFSICYLQRKKYLFFNNFQVKNEELNSCLACYIYLFKKNL